MDAPDETKAGNAIGVPLNETACGILRSQQGSISAGYSFIPSGVTEVTGRKRQRSEKCARTVIRHGGERLSGQALATSASMTFDIHRQAGWFSPAFPFGSEGNGRMGDPEMVQRYAHLSAGHLTEHASKIDAIIGRNVTNTAQEENVVYINSR